MAGLRTYEPAIVADPAVVRRPRPAARRRSTRATTRPTRTSCSGRSSGRPTATGCSRSATSSATATGSTGAGRATASSCRARCSSRSAAFDDSFSMPGGGYAEPRALRAARRDARASRSVTILGEGSFHQVHGGTTTNDGDPRRPAEQDRRATASTTPSCAAGSSAGPAKPMHYVGHARVAGARRTRSRRMTAIGVPRGARSTRARRPSRPTPTPIPDELKAAFIEAFWRGLVVEATRRGSATGRRRRPTDLFVLPGADRRACGPTGSSRPAPRNGGRALFLASICELLGHGRSCRSSRAAARPRPSTRASPTSKGQPHEERDRRAGAGDRRATHPHALVILGSRPGAPRSIREFEALRAARAGRARTSSSRTRSSTAIRSGRATGPARPRRCAGSSARTATSSRTRRGRSTA